MAAPEPLVLPTERPDEPSSMVERFGRLPQFIARRLTEHVHIDPAAVAKVRERGARGTIVYVLRQRSLLDYLLINWLAVREGLPLARFANGVSSAWFLPVGKLMRRAFARLNPARLFRRKSPAPSERERISELIDRGDPILIFLRARSVWMLTDRRARLAAARPGTEVLQEIVRRARSGDRPVYLVPVSLFRGRVFLRQTNRLSALAYSVHDAPSDLKKLITYRFNREDLLFTLGRMTDLTAFVAAHRALGDTRLARRLTNSVQRELAQEERAVWGPLLLPRRAIAERIFEGPEMARTIADMAANQGIPERRAWREARKDFWEMAASFNGFAFGIIEILFHQIWRRTFSGLEVWGLDRVAECVKEHPVVLVPCHRSHFDYMVLSYIFREHFLSPPHIAAGDNLSFWPISSLLRGSGAFFIRRRFEDDEIYKLVFHRYLMTLIRQGYTLEFFIEGGRSRTGKILTPKLGMLAGIVSAFLKGARRDLYLVPVSIHYGRIAEESSYDAELSGAAKERESFGALLRARSVLKQRHGTVYVSFAEPMSLRSALGERLQRFSAASEADVEVQEERRRFVQKLGFRLLREVNEVAVVGATSLSSTVLLSAPEATVPFADFAASVRTLAELVRWSGGRLSPSLERNLGRAGFGEIMAFLQSSKLVEVVEDGSDRVLRVPPGRRKVLDFYKNNTIHFFLLPSLLSHACLRGVARADLKDEVWWWLDLWRWEFPLPEREEVAAEIGRLLEYFRAHGASFNGGERNVPLVRNLAGLLENFREAYWIAARTASRIDGERVSEAELVRRMRRHFEAASLLGEVLKPEAATPVPLANAISRLVEIGCLERQVSRGERDRWITRGARFGDLDPLAKRIGEGLLVGGRSLTR